MNLLQKLTNWYFKREALPYWCVFIFDCAATFLAGLIVFWAYHNTLYNIAHFWGIVHTIFIYVFIAMIGFRTFRTYSGVLRYSSFVDLQHIAYANILSLMVAILAHYPLYQLPAPLFEPFRIRHLIVMYAVSTTLMWAGRVLIKELYNISSTSKGITNALVYGIKEGGVGLAKFIRNETPSKYNIRGFISPNGDLSGHLLMGVGVYQVEDLPAVLDRFRIRSVLVSPLRNNEFRNDLQLQSILTDAGVKIYMTKGYSEGTDIDKMQLKEVSIDDLLPRDEINVDMESLDKMLKGQRILITGSAGSIGSEMVYQVARFEPKEMILIDQAETPMHDVRRIMAAKYPDILCHTIVASITNQTFMEDIFRRYKPDYVFHAAAYKHVPMMEDNPAMAVQNNVYGTRVIADLAVKYGTKKFVMISTDKAVNPTNVMGCSKRICEIYCQSLNRAIEKINESGQKEGVNPKLLQANGELPCTQFVTTRFGNVLGSNGSVIPIFKDQIAKGGPVTVTHPDIIRYFMLIPEACKLVLEAGTMGKGGEIFVFDMGKPVRIADLAKRMITLSGAQDVRVEFTGLRDGEKLYEEVLNDAEHTLPTVHPKIMVAQVREYDYDQACQNEQRLLEASFTYDDMAIVKIMKEIVPEFKSRQSKYEALD